MSVVIGPQIIGAEPFNNAAPSGQKLIMKYATGFPGKWYYEVVPCRQPPKRCCQHGISDTATLTVGGTFKIDPTNQYNLVWNTSATGTFILNRSPAITFFDCPGTATPVIGNCGWHISLGGVASGYNYYFNQAGNYVQQGLDFRLVYNVGVALSNDYSTYQVMVVIAMWACGYVNDPGNPFIVYGNQPIEAAFGYAFGAPQATPSDPFDCINLVDCVSGIGGAAGFDFTVSTP